MSIIDINIIWVADHIAYTTEAHTHEYYHLIYCRKKGGSIGIGDTVYSAKNDHVYIAPPGVHHSMTIGSDMRLIEIKFTVADETLDAYLRSVPGEFQLKDVLLMKTMLLQVANEGMGNQLYSNEAANSALKLFLAHTVREFNLPAEDSGKTIKNNDFERKNGDLMVLRLRAYIEKNLHKELTLSELADKVGYNKTYLVKKTKLLWGMSPMQYVNSVRLEKAKQLLSSTDMSITEIAESIGFKCIHYFSRNFKRNVGITPSEYHKKYWS